MVQPIAMDDQPISATFFGEGKWLTDFITPNALEVEELHDSITNGISDIEEKIAACWSWVANNVKYKQVIRGKLTIEGKTSYQNDLWNPPSTTARVGVGNCANKSFLLASLIRQDLSPDNVFCVLGNLYNGKVGGHAWCMVKLGDREYIVESTRADIQPLVPTFATERYEAVHYFNDQRTLAVEGKTVLTPMTMCYSQWLSDYLDWAYINGKK